MQHSVWFLKLKLVLLSGLYLLSDLIRSPKSFVTIFLGIRQDKNYYGIQRKTIIDRLLLNYLPHRYLRREKYIHYDSSPSVIKKLVAIYGDVISEKKSGGTSHVKHSLFLDVKPKILVIRRSAMGDVILTTPAIRDIYENRAGFCEIYVATDFPAVFESSPYVVRALKIDELASIGDRFDQVIDLDMAYEKNKRTHVADVYGFYCNGRPPKNPQPYVASSELSLKNKELFFVDEHSGESRTIVVHNRQDPTQPFRGLHEALWLEIIREIPRLIPSSRSGISLKIYSIGLKPFDIHVESAHTHDLRDALSIRETKTLIEQADLFIGIDAGPLHLAACTNTPIIAFYTHVDPSYYTPRRLEGGKKIFNFPADIECSGCASRYPMPWGFHCARGDFACTGRFKKEAVYSAIRQSLLTD